jgi:hypothetical protein
VRSSTAKTSVNQNTSWMATPKAAVMPAPTTSPMLASPENDLAAMPTIATIGTTTGSSVSSIRFQTRKNAGPMR